MIGKVIYASFKEKFRGRKSFALLNFFVFRIYIFQVGWSSSVGYLFMPR